MSKPKFHCSDCNREITNFPSHPIVLPTGPYLLLCDDCNLERDDFPDHNPEWELSDYFYGWQLFIKRS